MALEMADVPNGLVFKGEVRIYTDRDALRRSRQTLKQAGQYKPARTVERGVREEHAPALTDAPTRGPAPEDRILLSLLPPTLAPALTGCGGWTSTQEKVGTGRRERRS